MHLNQRYDLWMRVGKKAFAKGLNSFHQIGSALISLYRSELPIIEKIQITFFTGGEEFQSTYNLARERYETRDARARDFLMKK